MDLREAISKRKIPAANIVVIIIALVIAFNIYNRQVAESKSLQKKIAEENKKNEVLIKIGVEEKKLEAYRRILAGKDASVLINTISSIAREAGVKIDSIRPSSQETSPNYIKVPVELSVSALDYNALGRFVSALESHKDVYIVDVMSIRLDAQEKNLEADMRISGIIYKE